MNRKKFGNWLSISKVFYMKQYCRWYCFLFYGNPTKKFCRSQSHSTGSELCNFDKSANAKSNSGWTSSFIEPSLIICDIHSVLITRKSIWVFSLVLFHDMLAVIICGHLFIWSHCTDATKHSKCWLGKNMRVKMLIDEVLFLSYRVKTWSIFSNYWNLNRNLNIYIIYIFAL